jgi:hypothetical protein
LNLYIHIGEEEGGILLTFRSVTRSEAWRSVRPDMSSTSLCNAGSEVEVDVWGEIGGGSDGDGVEVVASAVAVASARTRTRIHLRAETLCVAFSNVGRKRNKMGQLAWTVCLLTIGNAWLSVEQEQEADDFASAFV